MPVPGQADGEQTDEQTTRSGRRRSRRRRRRRVQDVAYAWNKLGFPEFWRSHTDFRDKFLAGCRPAFKLVRRARGLDARFEFNYNTDCPLNEPTPDTTAYRTLCRCLCLAARRASAGGRPAEAAAYLRDTLTVSRALAPQPNLITHLVAIAVDSATCHTIEMIGDGMKAGKAGSDLRVEVRSLIGALADPEHLHEAGVRALIIERNSNTQTILWVRSHSVRAANGSRDAATALADFCVGPSVTHAAARYHEEISKAVCSMKSRSSEPLYSPVDIAAPFYDVGAALYRMLLPGLGRIRVLQVRCIAIRGMAATALAVRCYEVDHGKRPDNLAALVPDDLPAAPVDPFSPIGAPIGYLPDAKYPRFYSVGDDRVDDGGEYELEESGKCIDRERLDMPFFLNGGREEALAELMAERESARQRDSSRGAPKAERPGPTSSSTRASTATSQPQPE